MSDVETARQLLRKAHRDLVALSHMNDRDAFSEDIFGFHVQQAAEKSLKGWLCLLGRSYPRTHDINLLLRLLEQAGQDVEDYEDFVEYNLYAVQLRYEDFETDDQPLNRTHSVEELRKLIDHVEGLLRAMEQGT